MKIGIDASRAFLKNRTGIEEYSYQVIKNLRDQFDDHQVILYVKKNQKIDFELPENWKVKIINWPRFWTQGGLSLEMLLHPVDALFVPAHTVPVIHPKKTIVTVHGLEYEFCREAYSLCARIYMRLTIKKSCQWVSNIVSVSENTKKDLMKLYQVSSEKIEVVYEGWEGDKRQVTSDKECNMDTKQSDKQHVSCPMSHVTEKFLLFIGRIEKRKNIENIVKAFEILKEKYNIPRKLILVGRPGYGYEAIGYQLEASSWRKDIIELGYVSEEEKWELLKKAEVFVFPTWYEGFGIPVLEAQSVGTAVVASNNSSITEVVADSALLVDPADVDEIAEKLELLISDESVKNAIINKGFENVRRFSWKKCSREISQILTA